MNHWIIVPIVLPALTAAFLVLALRHDLLRQRLVSIASTAALLPVAIALVVLTVWFVVRPGICSVLTR